MVQTPGKRSRLPSIPNPPHVSTPDSFPIQEFPPHKGDHACSLSDEARRVQAGTGAFVSGALGAALAASLLAAPLLLAPGAAWGCANSGTVSSSQDFSCTNAAYPTSIRRVVDSNASLTIRVPGGTGTGGTATVITGEAHWPGIDIDASDNTQTGNYAIYAGTSGAINIVDDTGSGNASRGIRILQDGSGTATVDVRSQVTMGSSSSRMRQHGIYVRSSGSGGAVTVTNAGTIYASFEGIDVKHDGPGTTTVTHSGTVNSLNHGMWVRADGAGPLIVTSSGDVTVTNTGQQGIRMEAGNNGAAMTLTATGGTITAPGQGIYMESRGTGAVIIQGTTANTGPTITSSASHGVHIAKSGTAATAGDISITTTGGSITPATTGRFHGIYVQDHAAYTGTVTIDNAADITAGDHAIRVERLGTGKIDITHSGGLALSRTRSGIFVRGPDGLAGDIDIDVTGGTVQAGPDSGSPAIRLTGRGDGDVDVTIAAGATAISHKAAGVFAILSSAAADDSQVDIDQHGRILGRSGVAVAILKHATAAPPVARMAQPLIDITWTGTFAAGTTAQTAPAGSDLLTAPNEAVAFIYARDAEASKASGGAWDAPAGIEAQVMSWSALAVEVAEGDDPGAFANAAAQQAAVPIGATASDNAYVKQFRAVLESEDFVVDSSLITAIDSTATSVSDLTDAEIVAYLRTDNAGRRTLLRNVLAQNLSDKEKAVLAALATGDSTGLTAALDDTDAGFSNAYKTAVRALLNRYNVGNVRVAMTAGSIDSRGDGIRAYYATPNANNGAIDVTVAQGAEVTGARAGVWVANAGMGEGNLRKQTVTVNGMVTGGTGAGVHLIGGGTVRVGATGRISATSGDGILSDGGDLSVSVAGMVDGDIRATGGALTFASLAGSQVTGTVHDPVGPLTVAGSIGRLLYTAGGAVTVASGGRLTGVGGEAIRSEAGDLSVTVAKGASITAATGTGIYVANAGSSVRVVNRGTITGGKIGIDVPAGSTVEHLGGTISTTDPTNSEAYAIRFRGTEGNSLLKVALNTEIDGKVQMLSGTADFSEACAGNIDIEFTTNDPTILTKSASHDDCREMNMNKKMEDDDTNGEGTNGEGTNGEGTNGEGTNGEGTNGEGTNGEGTNGEGTNGEGNVKINIRTPNYSAFALTDDMLSDLTGSIHGAVVETEMRPGTAAAGQVVWATPFGGARDQKGKGTPGVMDATHAFGGGLVGTSWGTRDVRVGGFIGGVGGAD